MSNTKLYNTASQPERCLLIGVALKTEKRWKVENNLEELASLAETAGAEVVAKIIQERPYLDPSLYIGKGKAEEIACYITYNDINLVVFDDELSPAQVKNLEEIFGIKVIDRSALILDIFAAHARTREARTQVELAQLNYYLPRLTRQWIHLSRQVGGIGTKGPGETQLETDRRLVRTRIAHLNKDLDKIKSHNETLRKRSKEQIKVALVGYTNVGKSTLMNALTDARTKVEDKLFATLDTTVRRLKIDEGCTVLLSDTVGFIRKIPHHLVASFQTTLAQTINADILLHVVDISSHMFSEQIKVVEGVLDELRIGSKTTLIIMNKVDRIDNPAIIEDIKKKYPKAILISAQKKIRIEKVKEKLFDLLQDKFFEVRISIKYNKAYLVEKIRALGEVLEQIYLDEEILLRFRILRENKSKLDNLLSNIKNEISEINHALDLNR